MHNIIVLSAKSNKKLVKNVMHAKNTWQRFRGLIGRKKLKADQGLMLTPCSSVHTIGMTYPLDVVFIDKAGTVLKCVSNIKPFRMAMAKKARHTLELAPGQIAKLGIKKGDNLSWN